MSSFVTRDATAADADALARLCTQLGHPATPDVIPARLARIAGDTNARAIVVDAPNRGGVVALATIHIRNTLNHNAPLAQLSLLVVEEAVRGTGVGRAIVDEAERWARDRGCMRMVVTTALRRTDAHAFYERIGYTHTGRRYAKDLE
ncbi:MAG TPA: GNAT family N-acetyltransferase [Gemmatimonadaceae bacterium]|nr:GNAT family N-acetyltransferase [Gemmatimonadaceae bacterium]